MYIQKYIHFEKGVCMFLTKISRSKYYQLIYFVNGKRTTVSTKSTTYRDALKFMYNFQNNNTQCTKTIQSSVSLLKFLNEYIEYVTSTKSKSYIRSINLSFKMLIDFADNIPLTRINTQIMDKFITKTAARTRNGALLYYRTLKAAFSKAVLWNYIPDNPLKKIKAPKTSKSFPVFISESELQLILSNTKEEYLKSLFYTAFYTGMRLGELVNMKWSWIDLNNNQITVKCSDSFISKSKKERIIPINQCLKIKLVGYRLRKYDMNEDEYVFYRIKGIKLNENYVSKKFKFYSRMTRLNEKIHFHSLRHSFASLLVQKGVSLYIIKELLGHEELSTTQIYSHLQFQNLREAVNLL